MNAHLQYFPPYDLVLYGFSDQQSLTPFGVAGGWEGKIQVSVGQLSDLYKIMILIRKNMVAWQDLNLRPSGYET